MPAVGLFVLSAVLWSFLPLFTVNGAAADPFAWGLMTSASAAVAMFCLAVATGVRPLGIFREVCVLWMRSSKNRWMLCLLALSNLQMTLFVVATDWAGPELAAVVYETAPIFLVVMLVAMKWGEPVEAKRLAFVVSLAVAGLLLMTAGKDMASPLAAGQFRWQTLAGLGIGLMCSVLAACAMACSLHLGEQISRQNDRLRNRVTESWNSAAYAVALFAVTRLASIPVLGLSAVLHHGTLNAKPLIYAMLVGAALIAPSAYFARAANTMKPEPNRNLLSILAPCAAVVWLWIFRGLDIASPVLFWAGTVAVIASGLLVQRTPDKASSAP